MILATLGVAAGIVLYTKQLREARLFSETIWFTSAVIPSYIVATALQWLNHDDWATFYSGAASVAISTAISFALATVPLMLFSGQRPELFPLPKVDGLKVAFSLIVIILLASLSISVIGDRYFTCQSRRCSNFLWLFSINIVFSKDFICLILSSAFLLSVIMRLRNVYYKNFRGDSK